MYERNGRESRGDCSGRLAWLLAMSQTAADHAALAAVKRLAADATDGTAVDPFAWAGEVIGARSSGVERHGAQGLVE